MTDDSSWGRVTEDGTIFVRLPDGQEHRVGQWAAGDPAAGLAHFARRYRDLVVEVDLAARRLKAGRATPDQVEAVAARLRTATEEPAFVGDIATLTKKIDSLVSDAASRRAELAEQRKQAREAAARRRDAIVVDAEALADSDKWKQTNQRFRDLLDEWKALPRHDREAEQDLWQRFSKARSEFERRRRQHVAQMTELRERAAVVKDDIATRAEALASSTDWTTTARAFRDLMDEWKSAPRAGRDEDERLWIRFRAAQDRFFNARDQVTATRDAEEQSNLALKRDLLREAEALLPVTDEKSARAAYRSIRDRWEEIGFVPRVDRPALERRIRNVETEIRKAEQDRWRRTDPAALARAQATAEQFAASVAKLERQHAKAVAAGDERKAADLAGSLSTTRSLLAAAESAVAEYSGG